MQRRLEIRTVEHDVEILEMERSSAGLRVQLEEALSELIRLRSVEAG